MAACLGMFGAGLRWRRRHDAQWQMFADFTNLNLKSDDVKGVPQWHGH